MTSEDTLARIQRVRELAAQNMSGPAIGKLIGMKRNTVASFCTRHKIKLTSIKRGRPRQAEAAKQPKPEIKFSNSASLVTHVVSEKMPTAPPRITPRCTWHGCTRSAFASGKPYCVEHHVKGGGLFCA